MPLSAEEVAQKLTLTAIRMRERMEELGATQDELAEEIKATQGAISQILTGATANSRLMPKLARALSVNLDWLMGLTDEKIDMFDHEGEQLSEDDLARIKAGTSTKRLVKPEQLIYQKVGAANQGSPSPILEPDPDDVEIDSIDLAYGMGGTFLDTDAVEVEKLRFSRKWLRQFTSAPPNMLCTTRGMGDSMMPTIHDQDVVLIDRSQRSWVGGMADKIWAGVFGGVGVIKRLRPMPDGSVKISSDNQLVRDEIAADGDLFIVGRVVAIVKSV